MPIMLGHDRVGNGELPVLVMNDWIGDTSTWDGARPYLDTDRFSWIFTDLRGYGRSRGHSGEYTLREAASDVLTLADSLGFERFAIVGHSMSSLVAYHLAQHHAERIHRTVVLTPGPPAGFNVDDTTLSGMQAGAAADDATRIRILRSIWGNRLSERWVQFKAARWRATSDVAAVVAYIRMYARDGLPDKTAQLHGPVLAITGEQDSEPMRQAGVTQLLSPLCKDLTVTPLQDCGHYPMQESPPLVVTLIERFLLPDSS
jgi:3-oxoadipate enol-lactonase